MQLQKHKRLCRNKQPKWEIKKGYNPKFIQDKTTEVKQMDRMVLIKKNKQQNQQTYLVPIILDYNMQYKQIEKNHKTSLAHITNR